MTIAFAFRLTFAAALGATPFSEQDRKVAVVPVQREDVEGWVPVVGEIHPEAIAEIVPRITGYLESVAVEEGYLLEKGAILATIAVPDLDAELAIARARQQEAAAMVADASGKVSAAESVALAALAAVASRQVDVLVREAEQETCRAEYAMQDTIVERLRKLVDKDAASPNQWEDAEGKLRTLAAQGRRADAMIGAAQAQVERARAEHAAASAAVAAAQASLLARNEGVAAAKAEVSWVEARRGFATLSNPYDTGLVTRRSLDPGAYVEAGGQSVVTVMDVSRLRLRVDIPEREVLLVDASTLVRVHLDANDEEVLEAKLDLLSGSLDSDTRSMRAWIFLDSKAGLLPGMWCRVELRTLFRPGSLVLPGEAIRVAGTQPFVLIVDGGQVARREVRLGNDDGLRTEVLEGLDGSEMVIVGNTAGLEVGDAVVAESRAVRVSDA